MRPPTGTEILESILARDDAPVSATTTAREHAAPTQRLGAATARYLDALNVAAEHHLGTTAIAHLEAGADRIVPGLADDAAWPTLRSHLVLLAATGADSLAALSGAAIVRELDSADDRAAVLDWRLHDPSGRDTGPLPWLPGIPQQLHDNPHWAAYLTARSDLVTDLAQHVRHRATSTEDTPPWWTPGRPLPTPDLLGDLAVWRAANAIPDSDHRPTGPTQPVKANAVWQHHLDTRLGNSNTAILAAWTALVHHLVPATRHDDYTSQLARHLAELSDAGVDAHALLHTKTVAPLPDDHAASALWWRIQNHLPTRQKHGEPAPLEWPIEDYTTVHDRDADLDMQVEPHHGTHRERRPAPVQHDQPRGPGISR